MSSGGQLAPLVAEAFAQHRRGAMQEAAALCRKVLATEPAHADANHLLGIIAYQTGNPRSAVELVQRAVSAGPGNADFLGTLGVVQRAAGETEAAIASFRAALRLRPGLAQTAANLGNALAQLGRYAEAAESYAAALRAEPRAPGVHNNLGNVLRELGRMEEAVDSFRAALRLNPAYVEAETNLGYTLAAMGRLEDAVASYRRALEIRPDHAAAHHNLGNALRDLGRPDDALASYRRVLEIAPGLAEAHHNIALVLKRQGRIAEALAACRQALELDPRLFQAWCSLGDIEVKLSLPRDAAASYGKALELRPEAAEALGGLVAVQNYLDEATPERTLALARRYAAAIEAGLPPGTAHANARDLGKRLRVGLLSGDLRNHAVSQFLEAVLANFDREALELFAYATSPHEDETTERLKQSIAGWRSVVALSDAEAAGRIAADGVDILIDLSGHTQGARQGVLARRPAPVQAGWLGYSGTTGLSTVDYVLADRWVVPEGEERFFSERPWRLPDSYLCFTPLDEPAPGPLPALATGRVTFGSFNNIAKLGDATLGCWAEVLKAVPGSRLVIKSSSAGVPERFERLGAALAARGVAAERVEFVGRLADKAAHLGLYGQIDIGLDPFPYNGTTTTCEALWMGVPVLTRQGSGFVSHVGESLLETAGLGDWIAADTAEYVSKAAGFAGNLEVLADLRASLRGRLAASALCDAPRFARNFEAALRGMWRAWCEGASIAADPRQ